MWLFECTKTYTEMRAKVSQSVFYIVLIEVFVLAQISTQFAEVLKIISFGTETEFLNIKIYIAYIYVPIIISVLENIFRLHQKLGRIFGVEKKFAKKVMFQGYINTLGVDVSKIKKKELYKIYDKNKIIKKEIDKHFYCFVSGTNPKIDEHYVHMALTAWCWVWILIDSISVTAFWGGVTMFYQMNGKFIFGVCIFVFLQVLILILLLVTECKKNTMKEIIQAVRKDETEFKGENNKRLKEVINSALSNR